MSTRDIEEKREVSESTPVISKHYRLLWFIAFVTGSAVTIFLLLIASGRALLVQQLTGMPAVLSSMNKVANIYIPLVWLPSLAAFITVALYSRRHFPALARRLWVGAVAGLLATFALDTFRQLGVIHGWLPVDTVMMFGKMIVGPKAAELSWTSAGIVYHFLNGVSFGVFYALVFGPARWVWGVVWALVVELGMMTLPPMAPTFGAFGGKTGSAALFLITLVAHLAYGVVLGALVQRWLARENPDDAGLASLRWWPRAAGKG